MIILRNFDLYIEFKELVVVDSLDESVLKRYIFSFDKIQLLHSVQFYNTFSNSNVLNTNN